MWDVFCNNYSKRNLREKAVNKISDAVDMSFAEIRSIINGLCAHFGREIAVTTKVKSRQGTDECYKSSWGFYDCLQMFSSLFLLGSSSSNASISINIANNFLTDLLGFMLKINVSVSNIERKFCIEHANEILCCTRKSVVGYWVLDLFQFSL